MPDEKPAKSEKKEKTLDAPAKADAELRAKREELLNSPPEEKAPGPPRAKRGRPRKEEKPSALEPEQIDEKRVEGWAATTIVFTMMLSGLVETVWPEMPMNEDEQKAHTRALAVYLSVVPPEDLERFAKLQLIIVYLMIFLPRVGSSVWDYIKRRRAAQLPAAASKEAANVETAAH
jgi:hypothetical protein